MKLKKAIAILASFVLCAAFLPIPALADDAVESEAPEQAAAMGDAELQEPERIVDDEQPEIEVDEVQVPDENTPVEVDAVEDPAVVDTFEPEVPTADFPDPQEGDDDLAIDAIEDETLVDEEQEAESEELEEELQAESEELEEELQAESEELEEELQAQASAGSTYVSDDGFTYYFDVISEADKTAALYWIVVTEEDGLTEDDYGTLACEIPAVMGDYTITQLGGVSNENLQVSYYIGSLKVPSSVSVLAGKILYNPYLEEIDLSSCTATSIPESFISYGGYDASGIRRISLPGGLTEIGNFAFADCIFLESIAIPDSVTRIGIAAFRNCWRLAHYNLPASLIEIDDEAFYNVYSKDLELVIPDACQTIGDAAFGWCSTESSYAQVDDPIDPEDAHPAFETVVIGNSVTSIGDYAFTTTFLDNDLGWTSGFINDWDMTPISSITLGSSLVEVGDCAFDGAHVTSLVLPASLQTIGTDYWGSMSAFSNLRELQTVTWGEGTPTIEVFGGFQGDESLMSVEVPASVTTFGTRAFSGCHALESIDLPAGLTTIGEHAFFSCGLTSITLPEGLQTIEANAFDCCESLGGTLVIPSTVVSIGENAFGSVLLADHYATIGSQRELRGCAFTELVIEDGTTPLVIEPEAFIACMGLNGTTINLPSRVNEIGGGAFFFIQNATFVINNPGIVLNGGDISDAGGLDDFADAEPFLLQITDPETNPDYFAPDTYEGWQEDSEFVEDDQDESPYQMEAHEWWSAQIPDPWASSFGFWSWNLWDTSGCRVLYPDTLTRESSPTLVGYLNARANAGDNAMWPTFEPFDANGDGKATLPADLRISLASATIDPIPDQVYTGHRLRPVPVVKLDGKTLEYGTDYAVGEYCDNINLTEDNFYPAKVTVVGKGDYIGEIWTEFNIVESATPAPVDISGATVSVTPTRFHYTGAAIKPAPTVKLNGTTLKAGTDYSVSYKNNKDVGTATVTVTGKNSYTGSCSTSFQVYWNTINKNFGAGGNVILVGSDGQVAGKTYDKVPPTLHPSPGQAVYFKTAPDKGFTLKSFNVKYGTQTWTVQNGNVQRVSGTGKAGTSSVYRFIMPDGDVTLTAAFDVNKRPITKNITGNGVTIATPNSNLMLVGSDGKPAGQTKDKVAPTMNPQVGAKVYFKSAPAKGAKLTKFNVTFKDENGKVVKWTTGNGITKAGDGLYCFTMPNYNVALNGEFMKK